MRKETFHEVVHQVDIGHLRLLFVSFLLHLLSLRLTRLRFRYGISLRLGRLSFLLSSGMLCTSLAFALLLFGLLITSIRLLRVGICLPSGALSPGRLLSVLSLRVEARSGTLGFRLLLIITIVGLQMDTKSFSLGLSALLLALGLVKGMRRVIREPPRIFEIA